MKVREMTFFFFCSIEKENNLYTIVSVGKEIKMSKAINIHQMQLVCSMHFESRLLMPKLLSAHYK